MINVAILGYGTVGSGVYEVLTKNAEVIAARVGEELSVKYVLDLLDFPGDPAEKVLVHDFEIIEKDPEVNLVVEVMGGVRVAYDFVKRSLLAGKSVATSNKELVAAKGSELLAIAKEKNVSFEFEASVGGGIPIIRPLLSAITADEILEVSGILNGTTNYMLSAMADDGVAYDDILKQAQDLGYAERNPEADVEGHDACRKIAILSSLVKGQQVDFEDIYTEGITKITLEDINYAKKLGGALRLLAISRFENGKTATMVTPFILDKANPLYSVNGVMNAVLVRGNMVGDLMFYGSGAGSLPTASAVVSDVVEEAKTLGKHISIPWKPEKVELSDRGEFTCRFFVRAKAAKAEVEAAFGSVEYVDAAVDGETAFLTGVMTETAFEAAAKSISLISRIRTTY